MKKRWIGAGVIGLLAVGAIQDVITGDEEPTKTKQSIEVVESSVESSSEIESVATIEESVSESSEELPPADKFVMDHYKQEIDGILSDYHALTDESIKAQLNEQVSDSYSTMFNQFVLATGIATEWSEGSDGYGVDSFILQTNEGHRVRVSAITGNDALDLGETVTVGGFLASPLAADELFIREASVQIQ